MLDGGEVWAWWAPGCDDHDRLVLVDVVHDGFNKGLDVEGGDVPHVRRCEVLVENCDAFGVDLPAHGEYWLYPQVEEGQTGSSDPIEEAEVYH